jgi:hypothetical protein
MNRDDNNIYPIEYLMARKATRASTNTLEFLTDKKLTETLS